MNIWAHYEYFITSDPFETVTNSNEHCHVKCQKPHLNKILNFSKLTTTNFKQQKENKKLPKPRKLHPDAEVKSCIVRDLKEVNEEEDERFRETFKRILLADLFVFVTRTRKFD